MGSMRGDVGAVLGILEQTAVELLGSTLCAYRNVPELGELGVVVELGDPEFANQLRGWIHVAERAVLANVNGGRAIDGILNLRRKAAATETLPLASCCA